MNTKTCKSQYIVTLRYLNEDGFERKAVENVFVPFHFPENEKSLHDRAEKMVRDKYNNSGLQILKIIRVTYA